MIVDIIDESNQMNERENDSLICALHSCFLKIKHMTEHDYFFCMTDNTLIKYKQKHQIVFTYLRTFLISSFFFEKS